MKNPDVAIIALDDKRRNQLMVHNRSMPNKQAEFAMALIQNAAMAGVDDGETAAGNQKLKPMPIDDAVDRGVALAEQAFAAFESKGWIVEYPPWSEIDAAGAEGDTKPGFAK